MHDSKACRFHQKKEVEGVQKDNQENQEGKKRVLVFCGFTLVA
jgi:hypothetical protein